MLSLSLAAAFAWTMKLSEYPLDYASASTSVKFIDAPAERRWTPEALTD